MLVVLSPESTVSENVLDEIDCALQEKKIIIPIVLSQCKIPFRIRRLQHIDFTQNYAQGFNRLLKTLNLDKTDEKEEELLWQQTVRLNSINAFQGFLEKYPRSKHIKEARLEKLKKD
jgi:hypothetical protein